MSFLASNLLGWRQISIFQYLHKSTIIRYSTGWRWIQFVTTVASFCHLNYVKKSVILMHVAGFLDSLLPLTPFYLNHFRVFSNLMFLKVYLKKFFFRNTFPFRNTFSLCVTQTVSTSVIYFLKLEYKNSIGDTGNHVFKPFKIDMLY